MQEALARTRIFARTSSLARGSIVFPYSGIAVDCMVRNLSERGASLMVDYPDSIPDDFDLSIGNDDMLKVCRVVWRSTDQVGVEFH